jgi:hypothetical protein
LTAASQAVIERNYSKMKNDIVELDVTVTGIVANQTSLTIPSGFRPANNIEGVCFGNVSPIQFLIRPNGSIEFTNISNNIAADLHVLYIK